MSGRMLDWFLNTLTPTPNDPHVPSTAEIIQKCLAVNPFDVKFREANRRISQTQDDPGPGGDMAPPPMPSSAGISMLKLQSQLSQSPTIFSNIGLLTAADLDLTRKLRESGFMNASTEGNRTPCTADVLNAVLDMNMNHQMANALAAANNQSAANSMLTQTSQLNTAPSIVPSTSMPEANGFNFQVPASSSKMMAPPSLQQPPPPPASSASAQPPPVSMPPMSHPQIAPEISAATNTLTSLHAASSTPVSSVTGLPIVLKTEQPDSVLSIDTSWEDVKPDISGPPTKRLATDPLIGHQQFYQSDGSPFSNGSSVSSVANSRQSEEPTKTTRKYHSRCTDGQTQRGGRGRRSTTSDMPPDERRQTILERNKAAAVRYRKRKKEEHDEMITRVNLLEQDKNSFARKFQTQNTVLRREVERLTELLKLRESRCVCHAAQLGGPVQNILTSLPPPDAGANLDHNNFNMHINRRPNN
uniref:BZIP domain-containing protein n=1 Tax=Panagrellus redivivus TaxID=6233 RepID=A0A7E4VFJ6_PANRE